MGSVQKARKFLEVSETHKQYSEIVEYVLDYFIRRAEKDGNAQFAVELKKVRQGYKDDFAGAIKITEEVYCDIFSDEELDDLIILHSNPATTKLRGLTSEIMNRVLEKYSLVSK